MKTEKECDYEWPSSVDETSLGNPYPLVPSEFSHDEQSSFGSMVFDHSLQALPPLPPSLLTPSFGIEEAQYLYHQALADPNYQLRGDSFYPNSYELCPLSYYYGFADAEPSGFDKSMIMSTESFGHSPNLESFQQLQLNHVVTPPTTSFHLKRRRLDEASVPQPWQVTGSSVRSSFIVSQSNQSSENSSSPSTSRSDLARLHRQKIGDRTRSLQKLLPWDRKMDMATMLEETYKYVKFLQAQVEALQWMPLDSSFASGGHSGSGALGLLTRLNRQQLLQVLLNCPAAQNMLYSQGLCVFSYEQLLLFEKMFQERNAVPQQSVTGSVSEHGSA